MDSDIDIQDPLAVEKKMFFLTWLIGKLLIPRSHQIEKCEDIWSTGYLTADLLNYWCAGTYVGHHKRALLPFDYRYITLLPPPLAAHLAVADIERGVAGVQIALQQVQKWFKWEKRKNTQQCTFLTCCHHRNKVASEYREAIFSCLSKTS